ncbi:MULTISPECIES: type II toxin-antitoxin system YafQ family toxin [unclassified Endozoicomonas]|uniref:type II toxin-antitoxin system YafQ family toxin n=1 Tax=unclassified Endozoicomonas TaxID=2644528 RepID=UPI0021491961|nr:MULTISPECIES: type II toxin-antitoxin system YafQ family toxin [unclassified Endozoicomonas]
MMLTPVRSTKFKKDYKKVERQGKDLKKLKKIMVQLAKKEPLEPKHKDHYLTGNHKGRRECHVESDWLLIYKVVGSEIFFERTGSHSDLFG